MKKLLITAIFFSAVYPLKAQDEPYYGGIGDGNASSEFALYTMRNSPMFYAYFGGDGDGFSRNEILPYAMSDPSQRFAYFGGDGDGFARNEILPYTLSNPAQNFAYFGGDGDGYARNEFSFFTLAYPTQFYAYFGGDGDGFARNEIVPYTMSNPPMFYAYFSGDGDGYSGGEEALFTMSNPAMFYAYFGGDGDGFAGDLLPLWIHPLSVNLLSFEGRTADEKSFLEWVVSSEKNISHYELERSGNGKKYTIINTQKAIAENGGKHTYTYTDAMPLEGNNYYRLRIMEKNATPEYSQVVLLYFKHGNESISVYPNPAAQTLFVKYDLEEKSSLRIVDMKGIVRNFRNADAGSNTIDFSLENLASGMYILQVQADNGFSKTVRFVKQ